MKFKIIACMNTNLVLGNEGGLLYNIPGDLKNFKSITTNSVVVMGRKTFESLPNSKPLSNRVNIIVTKNKDYGIEYDGDDNVHIVYSLEDAIELCEAFYDDLDKFVIGGGQLYAEALEKDLVDEMYITTVNDSKEGDTYFPNIFFEEKWRIFYQSYTQRSRPENLTYYFTIYRLNAEENG